MKCYSDENSDSEAESFSKKKKSVLSEAENRIEVKSSLEYKIADVRSPRKRKSSMKQSSVSPRRLGKTNERGELNNRDTGQTGENLAAANHLNIKQELLSDVENEDSITRSQNAARAKKSLFDGWDAKTAVRSSQKQSINECRSDDDSRENSEVVAKHRSSLSQDDGEKFSNRCEPVIKEEVILPDDKGQNSEDSDGENNRSKQEISSEFEGSDKSSDSYIPPSQFHLSQRGNSEDNTDEEESVKISKKLSPAKNEKDNAQTEENLLYDLEFGGRKQSKKKSPPRIRKTEIVSRKYKRIDQQSVKSENKFSSDEENPRNENNDPSRKKTLKTENRSEDSSSSNESLSNVDRGKSRMKQSPSKQKQSPKKVQSSSDESDANCSPGKREQSPKKMQSPRKKSQMNHSPSKQEQSPKKPKSPLKKKQTSKAEELSNESGVEAGGKVNKKAPLKQTLKTLLNDNSKITRPSICDDDTTSEEEKEEKVKRRKVSQNLTLGLAKPGSQGKKRSNSNSGQMVLVMKSNDQLSKNSLIKNRPISSKSSVSDDKNTESSSDDDSGDTAHHSTSKKLFENKSKHINESLDETELIGRATITDEEQSTSGSASASLTENNSNKEKADKAKKTPLKRKHSESNSDETESIKRAKLLSLSKKTAHTVSDSDDTDSLTKLNTTLNRSMAFIENGIKTTASNKSRKSVSINIKHKSKPTPAPKNATAQKSILKKNEHVASPDNEQNTNYAEEENIQQNVQSVNVEPKIIQRPLNFKELEQRDNLTYDASTKASLVLQDLSSDDEIYIVDVPRTVDPRELKGQTIRLAGKNKLQIGDQLYETCEKDVPNVSCVFRTDKDRFSYKTVNIKPAGCINIRQKLSKSSHIELSPVEKITVPFPKNLKTRHPLFGADYEDKIIVEEWKVSENIAEPKVEVKSISKSNEARNGVPEKFVESKAEKRLTKMKRVKTVKVEQTDSPGKRNESEIDCQTNPEQTAQIFSNYSSDSDSYEGFFQTVKHRKMKKNKRIKEEQNSSTISNIEKISSIRDPPVYSKDEIETTQQQELSVNKKLESLSNPSVIRLKDLGRSSKHSLFSSSTPNKGDKNRMNDEGEVSTNIFGKRKKDRKKREKEL